MARKKLQEKNLHRQTAQLYFTVLQLWWQELIDSVLIVTLYCSLYAKLGEIHCSRSMLHFNKISSPDCKLTPPQLSCEFPATLRNRQAAEIQSKYCPSMIHPQIVRLRFIPQALLSPWHWRVEIFNLRLVFCFFMSPGEECMLKLFIGWCSNAKWSKSQQLPPNSPSLKCAFVILFLQMCILTHHFLFSFIYIMCLNNLRIIWFF